VTLSVSTRTADGCTVVTVAGDVDISTSPELRSALAETTGARAVVVDLTDVPFLDSTALGVLVGAYTALRNNGGRFAVVNDHEGVLKVLRITALHDVFGVHPTLDAAIAAVKQPVSS
jgi:anti-sigma B factor antagonist